MKYIIGALQWKLPRAPLAFNPALDPASDLRERGDFSNIWQSSLITGSLL